MFVNFALLCPGMLLLTWTLIMLTKKHNTTQTLFTITLALCGIHILAEGIYITPNVKVSHIALINMVRQISAPIVLPIIALYVRALCGKRLMNWATVVWFVLIISQSVAIILFMVLLGEQHANDFVQALRLNQGLTQFNGPIYSYYRLICVDWYNLLLFIQMVYITIAAIVLFRKSHYKFRDIKEVWLGQSARIMAIIAPVIVALMAICIARRLLGEQYLISHPTVSAPLMLCMALIAHIASYTCHMKRTDPSEIVNEDDEYIMLSATVRNTYPIEPGNHSYAQMCQRLDKLVDQDKIYLFASITLSFMAYKMNTSTAYLTWLIKQRYNMRFREFVNHHRIEYAKSILRDKPEATLEYIASQSGYLSTSAFSKNFQQKMGLPPRLWAMNQLYKDKAST